MAEAKAHFVALGYKVTDMSASCPYDYAAEKGTDVIYIEVKGTSTAGERVILTYGEVEHARAHRGQMVLFILRNVQVTGTPENPVASGGTRTVVEPWEVDVGALTPISYMHRVPVHAPPS